MLQSWAKAGSIGFDPLCILLRCHSWGLAFGYDAFGCGSIRIHLFCILAGCLQRDLDLGTTPSGVVQPGSTSLYFGRMSSQDLGGWHLCL